MIIRISGEGQYRVDDDTLARLNELDSALESSLDADEAEFAAALAALLALVRDSGEELADTELVESDVILPAGDSSSDDVRAMLASDGLIPG